MNAETETIAVSSLFAVSAICGASASAATAARDVTAPVQEDLIGHTRQSSFIQAYPEKDVVIHYLTRGLVSQMGMLRFEAFGSKRCCLCLGQTIEECQGETEAVYREYPDAKLNACVVADAVAPFTAQEWWWATRDGYLGAMISAYVKSGGLAATNDDTLLNTLNVVPFTAQEWWWAMRDGYLNNMVTAYLKTGGLVMENDMVNAMPTSSVVPFTPQEWWWAMKDGYLGSMLSEQFQAGGFKVDAGFKFGVVRP